MLYNRQSRRYSHEQDLKQSHLSQRRFSLRKGNADSILVMRYLFLGSLTAASNMDPNMTYIKNINSKVKNLPALHSINTTEEEPSSDPTASTEKQ